MFRLPRRGAKGFKLQQLQGKPMHKVGQKYYGGSSESEFSHGRA